MFAQSIELRFWLHHFAVVKSSKGAAPAAAAAAATKTGFEASPAAAADKDSANERDDKSEQSVASEAELQRCASSEPIQELSPEEAARLREKKGKGKMVQGNRRTDSASSLR